MLSGLTGWADGDLTGDGIIDIRDFRQWTLDPAIAGSGMASAALNALGVPEPSSVILVLLSSAFFVNCRRRRTAGSANETEDRSQAMMSRKSLKVQRLIGVLSVLLVCGSANRGLSATLGNSPSAPAGPYLASQLTDDTGGLDGNRDYTDNGGPPGQTFQVSSAGMASRFTIKGGGNSAGGWTSRPDPFTGTEVWGIQISTVDSGTGALTVISSETATGFLGGGIINITDYLTFTLDTPVALSPGTTYAMSVALWNGTSGPGTSGGWFGMDHSTGDVYADGLAFNNNASTANPGNNSNPRYQFPDPGFVAPMPTSYDYVFAVQSASLVTIPGDTNGDGQVNLADYNTIRDNFRTVVPTGTLGDVNGPNGSPNGIVDLWDFAEWKENRTDLGAGSGSIVGVPEPASYVLLMTAATLVAGRRRRAANRIGS